MYNQALQSYGANFNTFQANQSNLYNRLMGVSQLGSNAAANLNNVQAGSTNALGNTLLSGAQLQGNDIMGVGNALAAGTVGRANALSGGLSGGANALGQGITLSQLLGAQNGSNNLPYGNAAANQSWTNTPLPWVQTQNSPDNNVLQ